MRLTELHEEKGRATFLASYNWRHANSYRQFAANHEQRIRERLDQVGIGWSEPLKFGIPDALRSYPSRAALDRMRGAESESLGSEYLERHPELFDEAGLAFERGYQGDL